jgi:cysteine synthase A
MDQFTHAERATDWRGNNNIAESIFQQMAGERFPVPEWIVMSAGTGGTTATIGRYVRYRRHATRLSVPDVEHSAFFDGFSRRDASCTCEKPTRIEGIGRPRVEPSFVPGVIDHMIRMPDGRVAGSDAGAVEAGSAGASAAPPARISPACACTPRGCVASGVSGSVVTLICDSGERYANTYHSDGWLDAQGFETASHMQAIKTFLDGGPLELDFDESS